MKRLCEICGAPIEVRAGICQSCGVSYAAKDEAEPLTLGQPRWGVMRIALPSGGSEDLTVVNAFRSAWEALERTSFQKLAPPQLDLISAENAPFDLIGPYSTYKNLLDRFSGQLAIDFSDRTPSQIEALLADLRR